MELQKKLEDFYKNPGPVVVGVIPGVSCFGPAYEFAFMLHYELQKEGNKTQGAHNLIFKNYLRERTHSASFLASSSVTF
jgi:hypothetical protein